MVLLPMIDAVRSTVAEVGGLRMDFEVGFDPAGPIPAGKCDIVVHGGPQRMGIVEVKVVMHGRIVRPRSVDVLQVGAYGRLAAGGGGFDNLWGAIVYVEMETSAVRMYGFSNARGLVIRTLELVREMSKAAYGRHRN